MPIIQNISRDDCENGWHFGCGNNAMLIQIADPATSFPTPKHKFAKIFQFEFLDAEDSDIDRYGEASLISDDQANDIVEMLQYAMTRSMNVIVHCHAGICRSGAVVEVASMIGFETTNRYRLPNLRVKHKLMKVLGWTYDSSETYSSSGKDIIADGISIPYVEYIELSANNKSANNKSVNGNLINS